jgi:hypothetical protein
MAEVERKSFPRISAKSWWTLRDRFRKSIPSVVDETYLSSVLGVSERSAKANDLPPLRTLGLIDGTGKPTERAVRWRDDRHYPEVCAEIREEVYPQALRDIAADPKTDRGELSRWFSTTTRAGEAAVAKMTATYVLLTEADPKSTSTGPEKAEKRARPNKPAIAKRGAAQIDRPAHLEDSNSGRVPPPVQEASDGQRNPSIHFDIQIHIAPETSADQIEAIFASMAKHLKPFR